MTDDIRSKVFAIGWTVKNDFNALESQKVEMTLAHECQRVVYGRVYINTCFHPTRIIRQALASELA